jgi:spoIIIJ-associated protein
MNPYERRIIHTAVQEVEGATSWSEGEDMNRHVVIGLAEGVRPTRPRSNNHNRRPDNRRNGNNRGGERNGNNRTGERKSNRPYNANNSNHTTRPQITDVVTNTSVPTEVRTPVKPEPRPAAKTYSKESASVPLYGRIDVKK